ncbi:hypothetical protein BpHYR1_050698 [Brachionus plicatilis]|uniref:Uncharacterized protein n=1 Tax=Brachionus plicatilis TaxID=10195 RepID=A0A3M7P3L0_BRAPC|nr:hypothetical protein BpHYR1_050698 [Brachionus plicatilis]
MLQEPFQIIVQQTKRVIVIMTCLRMKHKTKLGLRVINRKKLFHPIDHVLVSGQRSETQFPESGIVLFRFQIEQAHVMINWLPLEA